MEAAHIKGIVGAIINAVVFESFFFGAGIALVVAQNVIAGLLEFVEQTVDLCFVDHLADFALFLVQFGIILGIGEIGGTVRITEITQFDDKVHILLAAGFQKSFQTPLRVMHNIYMKVGENTEFYCHGSALLYSL